MEAQFESFIRERRYLRNVSPRTIQWYEESLKWLRNPVPTEQDLKDFVIRMRQAGLKATSCNNRIRAVNAYLRWSGRSSLEIPRMKESQRVLPTFTVGDIGKFAAYKPNTRTKLRLQIIVLLLADTGVRIDEALSLRWTDIDFDNLLICVRGKGDKERKIPYSYQLRKYLVRLKQPEHQLVFCTRDGNKLGRRVVLRDVKLLSKRLGIVAPERTLHALRHTFAVNYLRLGGSVFHLQRALGHSSLEMSRRYANLMTSDLQAVHQQVSLLAGRQV